ncbi:MAG: transcriptional repressor [Dehalococcoidia bacterium]|nr:transcriptional repressor [Dehalococcoidia bacterium]
MSIAEETRARLVGSGCRVTAPRRAILDVMARATAPFTAEELVAAVPEVGRATVFRTVKLFQEAGVLCRVVREDGSPLYQLSGSGHHHHLVCSECGSVGEFSDAALDALIAQNADAQGFALDGHSLELYGRCRRCRP